MRTSAQAGAGERMVASLTVEEGLMAGGTGEWGGVFVLVFVRVFVLVLGGGGTLRAQTGSVDGTVFDSVRGGPLAGAMVLVEGTPNAVRSDAAGRFRLDSVAVGSIVIAVESDALDAIGVAVVPARIELGAGEQRTLALATPSVATLLSTVCPSPAVAPDEGVLSGVVRDAATRVPVADATVDVSWDLWVIAGTKLEKRRRALAVQSDAQGVFIACGVPAGAPVSVRARGGTGLEGGGEVLIPDTRLARRDVGLAPPGAGVALAARGSAGVHLGRAQIEKAGAVAVPELLRSIPGFRVSFGAGGASAVWTRQRRNCAPIYYLDGQQVEEAVTGRSSEVEELIAYSPGQAPPSYGGAAATCAVVLIWTRRSSSPAGVERSDTESPAPPP